MKRIALAFVCLFQCTGQNVQPIQGVLTGTITGDDGAPIAGAYVGLTLLPPYPQGSLTTTEWTTVSEAGGKYQLNRLIEGSYQVCAQVSGTAYLNPCEWGLQPPLVSLSSAQPTASVNVVLKKGAVVPVHFSDPGGLFLQNESKAAASILLGIRNDAFYFRPAQLVSADTGGRSLEVVIPFGVAENLVVYSPSFQLTNALGVVLPKTSVTIPIMVPLGQQAPPVNLIVTAGGSQ